MSVKELQAVRQFVDAMIAQEQRRGDARRHDDVPTTVVDDEITRVLVFGNVRRPIRRSRVTV